jgi:aldehyde:ferredoxin oxidoreductase
MSAEPSDSYLAQHDIKMIIFESLPADDKWYYLIVRKDSKLELMAADVYKDMSTYTFVETMNVLYGKDIAVAVIGVAGTRKNKIASVMVTDFATGHPCRAAGRGGMGAVMGSKKIKAIVIEKADARPTIEYADKEKFNIAMKKYAQAAVDFPPSQALHAVGTHIAIELTAPVNVDPVNNFSGAMISSDNMDKFNGKAFVDNVMKNGGKVGLACQPGCVVKCSNYCNNSKGEYLTGGLEYETTVLCGPNCDSYDLDYIAQVDRICDEYGVDALEIGCSLAICMEEGKIAWGDQKAALNLLSEMVEGKTEMGKLLANGAAALGQAINAKRIPVVKKQSLAAYDPRGLKGIGVTFAASPMGADHTYGNPVGLPVDGTRKEGNLELSRNVQIGAAFSDNLGCDFGIRCGAQDPEIFPNIFAGRFGGEWNMDKIMGIAVETIRMELAFNKAAGFTDADDKLPSFFADEETANGYKWDFTPEEISKVYSF